MLDDLRLAWRNVWRNTRRSLVTMGAISLALLFIILYTGLVAGYVEGLQRNVLDLEMGEAQAYGEGYREKPSLYTKIEKPAAFLQKLRAEGFRASPRLLAAGLGAGVDNSGGVQLIGIDVQSDREVSKISQQVEVGKWLEPGDNGAVLGRRVAETLNLEIGGELVVLSQAADGSMANEVYPVRGILRGVSEKVDRGGVFLSAAAFRELMVFPEGAHQIIIRYPDGADLGGATATVATLAPEKVEVANWKTLQPTFASMLQSVDGAMAVMMGIFYIAVGIVVLNAMLMAVFERIKEFGVLKAIGFGPFKVFRLILIETAIQSTIAICFTVLLAIPLNAYLSTSGIDLRGLGNISVMGIAWDPIWRSKVELTTYLRPCVALMFIILLSVLYPALRATFIRPLDAIRS